MDDRGLVNGNIRKNGVSRGMVNGLTNGKGNNGLVNGSNSKPKEKKSIMSSPKGRMMTWAVIGIVLLLIFGVFAVSTNAFKKTDWNLIKKYIDVDMENVAEPAINIEKFAFHLTKNTFEFYLDFQGNFANAADYKNLAYILIDNDTNIATGYNTGDIGADYLVKLSGYNGTVSASFLAFNGNGAHVWNWSLIESVSVVRDGDYTITGAVNHIISKDARIMVIAQTKYYQDITPVVGIEKPALLITEIPHLDNNTLELKFKAMYGAVSVGKVTLSVPMGVEIPNLVDSKLPAVGTVSTEKSVFLSVDTSNVFQRAVEVKVTDVEVSVPYTIWGEPFRKYVGTPDRIEIDGCFQDWNTLVGPNYFNYNPTGNVDNPNIDLYQYADYEENGTFFYASVKGTMLKGAIAPEMEEVPSGWSGNVTPLPKGPASPYDYAEITFITSNNEKHVVQVYGFNGKVVCVLFDGQQSSAVKVAVGKNGEYGALEIGLTNQYDVKSYTVKMTDWNEESDVAKANTILIPTRRSSITVDGDPSDWTGTAPTGDNTFTISNGEFIWKDAEGDERTDNNNTYDIEEFRLTSDGTYLYYLITFNSLSGIGSDGAPGIMITLDTDQTQNSGQTYFAYNSDTQVAQNGNANWEYQIAIDLANSTVSSGTVISGDGKEVWNEGGPLDLLDTGWNDISTSSDEFVASTTTNVVEGRILLSEIGNPSEITVELGIVKVSGTGEAVDVSGASDIMDAMTTTGPNTWDEVSDGYIDYYMTITFDTTSGDVTHAVDSDGTEVPELSPAHAAILAVMIAVPVVLRRRRE